MFMVVFVRIKNGSRYYIGDEDLKHTLLLSSRMAGYSRLETFDFETDVGKHTKSG